MCIRTLAGDEVIFGAKRSRQVMAMIDTGADESVVSQVLIDDLGTQDQVIDSREVWTATGPHGHCPTYAVNVVLMLGATRLVIPARVTALPPSEDVDALIGRDLLDHMRLVYDGPGKCFSLGIGTPPAT